MSLDATRWAWKQPNITSGQKLALLALADRAGETHCAYPSIERLAKDTCLNRKTIISCLDGLEILGLLRDTGARVGRTGKVKVYELIGVECRHDDTTAEDIKQSQKRDHSKEPKSAPLNSPETGTTKQSQNRYSEPSTTEPNTNTPLPPAEADGLSPAKADDGAPEKKPANRKPKANHQGVIDAFNEILGEDLAEVRILNEPRKRAISKMWNYQFSKQTRGDSVEFWHRYFRHVLNSKSLTGRKPGFDWSPGFDWLMKEKNMARIIEGEFHKGDDVREDLPDLPNDRGDA